MFRYLILPVLAALQAAGQTQTDLMNEAKDAVAAHDYAKAAEQFRAVIDGPAEPDVTSMRYVAWRRFHAYWRIRTKPKRRCCARRRLPPSCTATPASSWRRFFPNCPARSAH